MRYLHWPLAISVDALKRLEIAIGDYLIERPLLKDHERVEMENIANEARAMLQKPGLLASAPEPEDELLS